MKNAPLGANPTIEAAQTCLEQFGSSELGVRYPAAVATWENAWERFTPFLGFPPALRRIIYTTNAIESLNYQLRKIIKNRGHFPNDVAAVKLLWLAICNIEDKRAMRRAKEKKGFTGSHLLEGAATAGCPQALGALVLTFPDRINQYL